MSKKPVKKSTPKKLPAKGKKTGKAGKRVVKKKKSAKSTVKNKTSRSSAKSKSFKRKSEKELAIKEANVIANSEKKKRSLIKLKGKRPQRDLSIEETSSLLKSVIEGMRERKAKNIAILDLKKIENRVCDAFVICDADSKTHVMSIAESVEEMVHKLTGETPYHSEGQENSEWILVDYVNVVAHVFLRETREHYNIEGLWGDAKFTLINN